MENREYRIADKDLKLSRLRTMRLGAKPEVELHDGERLAGKLARLDAFPLLVGKQSLSLDLATASEVNIEAPQEVTVLLCTVLARQEGREVGRSSFPL